ncbi:uncharacterized protein LAESUDRAFT_615257, partial [Laetiporus sulphureus 93-53]
STVQQGTIFENRSLALAEEHLSMSLKRVGGSNDGGIDLLGWWWLPSTSDGSAQSRALSERKRYRIVAQCKDEKIKMGPKYLRELEGVLYRYLAVSRKGQAQVPSPDVLTVDEDEAKSFSNSWTFASDPVVGVLISSSPFTKATLLRANSSPLPLVLLHIPREFSYDPAPQELASSDEETEPRGEEGQDANEGENAATPGSEDPQGTLGALVFNPALASSSGLLRGQIQPRWEHPLNPSAMHSSRPGLWFNGQRVLKWTP